MIQEAKCCRLLSLSIESSRFLFSSHGAGRAPIKMLVGMLSPDSGTIFVDGKEWQG